MKRVLLALLLGAAMSLSASAATFSVFDDFSTSTNTATNRWSYWSTTNTSVTPYASNIALIGSYIAACGAGSSDCWNGPSNNLVYRNGNATPDNFGGLSENAAGTVAFYSRLGITNIRFLVPTTSTYDISGFFDGDSISPISSTRALIVVNGDVSTALYDVTAVRAFNANEPFNFVRSLTAGDTVDFLVAVGSGIPSNSGSLGFNVTISDGAAETPEPAGFVLLGGGLALAALRRRR